MVEELNISVAIDRSFDFKADVALPRGSTVLQLKERLAALDPTGKTEVSSFGLGLPGPSVQPLPDATVLTEEHLALDVCAAPGPAEAPGPSPVPEKPSLSPAEAAREAARQAAKQAQAARKEREAAAARAKEEEDARKRAEAEAARARLQAQAAQAAVAQPQPQPSPAQQHQAAPVQPQHAAAVPTLAGVPIAEDTGETRVKGVSADGRYVFAYVGDLKHPHDVLALVELFKGMASVEDLQANRARFVYAGGTQDKATSLQVQHEVVIEATGLEKGDYELASFAHDDLTRQLNKHLTKDNCVVMFGGKCLKIVAQHGI